MSEATFEATLGRIAEHCRRSAQNSVQIIFHGGEPTLVPPVKFAAMCAQARKRLGSLVEVSLAVQTNGTRLDDRWIDVLREHDVQLGISLDGPREIQDRFRVDHRGRGSYGAVAASIERLNSAGVPFGILSVIQPGADSLLIHRHFVSLGCRSISYLFPAENHETIGPIRRRFGPTPCSDFLIPIFDEWWENSTIDVRIREFWEMSRAILGGTSQLDSIGNPAIRFVSVETDGSIHGLDKLRTCEDGMTDTKLTVHDADFGDIARLSTLHAAVMAGLPLPTACRGCPERGTCGGGYVPARYSRERGFDNPSVWCADLLALFTHIRERLGVTPAQTLERRAALAGVAA
jgi:uncharacterized protein